MAHAQCNPRASAVFSFHPCSVSWWTVSSNSMGLITGVLTLLYHLPQIYKWLLKPYYIVSFLMTVAFLVVRKTPGLCEHLATDREDGNSCDFDWVSMLGEEGVVLHAGLLSDKIITY